MITYKMGDISMKSKRGLVITSIALILALAGCAGVPAGEQSPDVTDETQPVAMGTFSEADLVFVINGVSYPLNSDAAPLLEVFGADYTLTAAPSCRYVGEDKMFEYAFATVLTYPLEDKDMIDEIYIKDGEYTTSKGIGIGSTLDEVKAAYGDGGFDIDGVYTYLLSGDLGNQKCPQLYFEISDGKVVAFGYYAASNVVE